MRNDASQTPLLEIYSKLTPVSAFDVCVKFLAKKVKFQLAF